MCTKCTQNIKYKWQVQECDNGQMISMKENYLNKTRFFVALTPTFNEGECLLINKDSKKHNCNQLLFCCKICVWLNIACLMCLLLSIEHELFVSISGKRHKETMSLK